MKKPTTAVLHYSSPPVAGGVEAVIGSHARVFIELGFPYTVITGSGKKEALYPGADFICIPEIDSQHPDILQITRELVQGIVPDTFAPMAARLKASLEPLLREYDNVIVHNIFTKQYNLPLTAALVDLMNDGYGTHFIAWCHDIAWTSDRSRRQVFPGSPWDLLRTDHSTATYVAVSKLRQKELAGLLERPEDEITVIYNGVDPALLLGLSEEGQALIERLGLFESQLNLLMPVRVTWQKNIEFAIKVTAALKENGVRVKTVLTGPPDPHDEKNMTYYQSLLELRREMDVEDEMRFVFESGPEGRTQYTIGMQVVADLYRVSDAMFIPSHSEGFGMPVLEAGLVGLPVVSSSIPAADEIGKNDLLKIDITQPAEHAAEQMLSFLDQNLIYRMRRRVRNQYTWKAIFQQAIRPLLQGEGV